MTMDFGEWDEDEIRPEHWLPECKRVLKENGVLISFYDYTFMEHLTVPLRELGFTFRQKAYWHKSNPLPRVETTKWQDAIEEIVIATMNEGREHHFQHYEQRHNVIESAVCRGDEREEHPTQKPKSVIKTLVKWWSHEGDVILDPFFGTGTTGVVAEEVNRQWIGVERKEEYIEIAERRIEAVQKITKQRGKLLDP